MKRVGDLSRRTCLSGPAIWVLESISGSRTSIATRIGLTNLTSCLMSDCSGGRADKCVRKIDASLLLTASANFVNSVVARSGAVSTWFPGADESRAPKPTACSVGVSNGVPWYLRYLRYQRYQSTVGTVPYLYIPQYSLPSECSGGVVISQKLLRRRWQ